MASLSNSRCQNRPNKSKDKGDMVQRPKHYVRMCNFLYFCDYHLVSLILEGCTNSTI